MVKAKKPNRKKRYREYDAETLMQERQYGFFWYDWIWRVIRPLLIGALSLIMISGMLLSGWKMCIRDRRSVASLRFVGGMGELNRGASPDRVL